MSKSKPYSPKFRSSTGEMPLIRTSRQRNYHRSERKETNSELLKQISAGSENGEIIVRIQCQVYQPDETRYVGLKDSGFSLTVRNPDTVPEIFEAIREMFGEE